MKISTNWLKDFVTLAPPFEKIAERLTLAGLEVKRVESVTVGDRSDTLFEIEITSNRPDWLSHYGVARELAAVENLSLKAPASEPAQNRPLPSGWKVTIKDQARCPYYTGVYVEGLAPNQPTPDFIKDRLAVCGHRSISLIVDITNYVLLETGQPLHAFDADLIRGQEILVRSARAEETMTTIDGDARRLAATDLVIADRERAVALAGIMGGRDTEVTDRTRNIFLESAFFLPTSIRQSARRLGLASDSSYRFERRVDPEGVDWARERALSLIKQYAKPRFISGVIKAGQRPVTFAGRIHLSGSEIEKCLGVRLKTHQVPSILQRLGFDVKPDSQEAWNVGVPSFRSDVTRPVDLIEEVARIYGYDQIPETLPSREPVLARENPNRRLESTARQFFCGLGLFETVTFSLISEAGLSAEEDLAEAVSIVNPQNKDLRWMRPTLLPSLLGVLQKNVNAGASQLGFYEIANIYHRKGTAHPHEEKVVGLALAGKWRPKQWSDSERDATFFDLKGCVEVFLNAVLGEDYRFVPGQQSYLVGASTMQILSADQFVGFLGEVAPPLTKLWDLETRVYYAEIHLDSLVRMARARNLFRPVSKFPAVERDLAVVVKNTVKAGEIQEEIRRLGSPLVQAVTLFDLFEGGRVPAGCKNLAFRVTYQSPERTLVSDEVQKRHTEIADRIAAKYQAAFQ